MGEPDMPESRVETDTKLKAKAITIQTPVPQSSSTNQHLLQSSQNSNNEGEYEHLNHSKSIRNRNTITNSNSNTKIFKHFQQFYSRISWSLDLENKGSVARDHLANERTFLAWLRTSISLVGVGIAITQLFRLNTTNDQASNSARKLGKPLGITFIAVAFVFLLVGAFRYLMTQAYLTEDKFPASRGSISLVTGLLLAIIVAGFASILAVG